MPERTTLYVAALALGACARGPAALAPADAPRPTATPRETGVFEVSSLGSHYAIRGQLLGHFEVRPDRVIVDADQGALRTSDAPAAGRADTLYRALAVSVVLGRADGDSWRVAARGPRRAVTDAVVGGVEYRLPPLRLAVARPRGDLSWYWLAFQFAATDPRPGRGPFTVYACASEGLLGAAPRARRAGAGPFAYERSC